MVLLAGDIPGTGICRDIAAHRIAVDAPNSEVTGTFLDLVAHGLEHGGAVVVLYPSWAGDGPRRLVRLARGAMLTDRIAALPLDLPPLALSVVADQLAFVAPHVDPGTLASLGHTLRQEICAGAWVNSVSRLENVPAGLGAHLSSYLPGQGFSVCAVPVPEVHRITSSKPVQDIGRLPPGPVLVVASQAGGDVDWLRRGLQPAVGAASVMLTGEQPLGATYWGTKKYVEYVAFSAHAQALHMTLRRLPRDRCSWCGASAILETCFFCGMTPPKQAPPPPTPPAPAAPPPVAAPGPHRVNGRFVQANGGAPVREVVPPAAPVPLPPPQARPPDGVARSPGERLSRERDPTGAAAPPGPVPPGPVPPGPVPPPAPAQPLPALSPAPAPPPAPRSPDGRNDKPPITRPANDRSPEVLFAPTPPPVPGRPGRLPDRRDP
ncbi:hypothetical protein Acsp03_64100 [Actinomadura sp. NBRC 104412]|nr:hypothetical protein Acsp03_64100 [Actinomadura sp. NBRC 104412]